MSATGTSAEQRASLATLPRATCISVVLWFSIMLLAAGITIHIALTSGAQFVGQWAFRGSLIVLAVVYTSVGALIVIKRPTNRIGWLLLVIGVLNGFAGLWDEYSIYSNFADSNAAPPARIAYWISGWIWIAITVPAWTILPLLFPDGRLLSPRWRPALWLANVGIALGSIAFAFASPKINGIDTIFSVYGYDLLFESLLYIGAVAILISSLAGVLSLVLRLRRARSVERQQIKWFAFAAALLALSLPVISIPAFESLIVFTTLGMPVATAVAILRYQLFDIDIIIRRTLVYSVLTLTLGATYLIGVVALQALFVRLTGQENALAVVASTLAIAALFGPLRRQVQAVIDRRFYRRKYDARQVVEQFAQRVQQQADIDTLAGDILQVVNETVQPEQARIWLLPNKEPRP